MKYIKEQSTWLKDKKETWSKSFSELIYPFHENIENLIDVLKEDYNDKSDPIKVHQEYLDYMNDSFDNLRDSVRLVNSEKDLVKLWDELSLNMVFWKEHFKKMSEKLDNYNSIFKLGYEIFSTIVIYNTKKILKDYYDLLKGNLDDKRENISKFIKNVRIDINNRIVDINATDIFSMTNLGDKEIQDYTLNHGDEVRYYMNDGQENHALISHNQEELQDKKNIRLVSKKDGENFEINRTELIEILPKHKTLNQEVADKLKKIKDDPTKLEELSDYLDKLKVTESLDITKDDYLDITIEIFPKASDIKYNEKDNIISFNQNGSEKIVNIYNYKGIFNEGSFYRIIGAKFSNDFSGDYILFINDYELYVFKYDKALISILDNSDIIIDKTLFLSRKS